MVSEVGRQQSGNTCGSWGQSGSEQVNVGNGERQLSVAAGGLVLMLWLRGQSLFSLVPALLAGGLLYRGLTGHCGVYERLGMTTAEEQDGPQAGRSPGGQPRYAARPTGLTEAARAATGELGAAERSSGDRQVPSA